MTPFSGRKQELDGKPGVGDIPVGLDEILPPALLGAIRRQQLHAEIGVTTAGLLDPTADVAERRVAPHALAGPIGGEPVRSRVVEPRQFRVGGNRADVDREVEARMEIVEQRIRRRAHIRRLDRPAHRDLLRMVLRHESRPGHRANLRVRPDVL